MPDNSEKIEQLIHRNKDLEGWQQMGRTALEVAGNTISITGMTAKKYLMVVLSYKTNNVGTSGDLGIRFNDDSGSNYSYRHEANGAADVTAVSQTQIDMGANIADSTNSVLVVMYISNKDTYMKSIVADIAESIAVASAPTKVIARGTWGNIVDQITRIDAFTITAGQDNFAAGSEMVVFGRD